MLRPFIDRLNEIIVERSDDGIQPAPIVVHGLKDHGAASAWDANFLAVKAKVLRLPDRLDRPDQSASLLRLPPPMPYGDNHFEGAADMSENA